MFATLEATNSGFALSWRQTQSLAIAQLASYSMKNDGPTNRSATNKKSGINDFYLMGHCVI
jgi:hypothetical protein